MGKPSGEGLWEARDARAPGGERCFGEKHISSERRRYDDARFETLDLAADLLQELGARCGRDLLGDGPQLLVAAGLVARSSDVGADFEGESEGAGFHEDSFRLTLGERGKLYSSHPPECRALRGRSATAHVYIPPPSKRRNAFIPSLLPDRI